MALASLAISTAVLDSPKLSPHCLTHMHCGREAAGTKMKLVSHALQAAKQGDSRGGAVVSTVHRHRIAALPVDGDQRAAHSVTRTLMSLANMIQFF